MYPVWVGYLLCGVVGIWLLVLSYWLWREKKLSKELFPKSGERDIRLKFKQVLSEMAQLKKNQLELSQETQELYEDGLKHVQKIALTRYNPYNDTGGNQSFSVVLLDGQKQGLVITSLHTRAGTRTYIRMIVNGKSEVELSKEEREVLEEAISS